jgi:DNA methylase
MQCPQCYTMLMQPAGRGRRRRFCSDACKMRFARGTPPPKRPTLPPLPVWHHGRFEDYAPVYAGQVQVIITDPPYGRKHVPIYQALARFAATVLAPKGYLICMCGWEEVREVLNVFHADQPGLLPLGQIGYYLVGNHGGQGRRPETNQVWTRHHKCILWYQQTGGKRVHRRSGTTDVIVVPQPTQTDMDKARFKWEQSLAGFEKLVERYTNNEDVICDPMMGAGTTLIAARHMHRPRTIGIERDAATFAIAHGRLSAAGLVPGQQGPRCQPMPEAVQDPTPWQQLELVHREVAHEAAD